VRAAGGADVLGVEYLLSLARKVYLTTGLGVLAVDSLILSNTHWRTRPSTANRSCGDAYMHGGVGALPLCSSPLAKPSWNQSACVHTNPCKLNGLEHRRVSAHAASTYVPTTKTTTSPIHPLFSFGSFNSPL
jgi:hypothetical protein